MYHKNSRVTGWQGFHLWLFLWGSTVYSTPAASFHHQDQEEIADMGLESLLEVPLTVASLASESFRDAPSSVTVFTRREIQNMGILTIEDLLNFVPGMQAARTASRSVYSVSARGRISSQLSNDILFLINGQRLNDDFSGTAVLFNRFLTTGNVAQVEVIRGPGSALYGSNAFLGVVNIVTSVDLNEASLAGSSHRGRDGHIALSGGNDRYHASLFVSGLENDGEKFIDRSSPDPATTRDPEKAFSLYATLDTGNLRIDARHTKFDVDEFYVFGVTPANDINEYHADDSSLYVSYDVLKSDTRKLKIAGGVRRINNDGLGQFQTEQQMRILTGDPDAVAFYGGSVLRLTEWDFNLDGSIRLNAQHQLFGGFEYRYTVIDEIRNQNNYETTEFPSPAITFYGDVITTAQIGPEGSSRRIYSAYLQDKIALSENLNATLGVRFDHYSDFGSTTNPRMALVYQPRRDTTFKLMYGQAFRAPNVLELELKNSPRSIGNENLKPEKIRTLELAWLQEFGPYQITVTGYRSWISDQIMRRPFVSPMDPATWINSGSDHLSGIELEIKAAITPQLTVRGSYAHGFEVATNPQSYPINQGSIAFNYRTGRFNANLNLTYRGSVDAASRALPQRLDHAWRANLHLRYRWPGLTLFGGVSNIGDDDNGDFTTTAVPGGSPVRGREYRVGLEIPLDL